MTESILRKINNIATHVNKTNYKFNVQRMNGSYKNKAKQKISNNVKVSMKGLKKFVNCKQQGYNKKMNEHSGYNGKCKYKYKTKYVNVCKFVDEKQIGKDVSNQQGNNYTRLNTMSTTNSMNNNDNHNKLIQLIKPYCYHHRKLHSLYVINRNSLNNNDNNSISRNHTNNSSIYNNNGNNMCNRSVDISNLQTKDGSCKTISYFINNLHNTPSSSNEDKLSFLTSQKHLTLMSAAPYAKPTYHNIFLFKPTLAYKNFGIENYNISLLSLTTNKTLFTFNILSISSCTHPNQTLLTFKYHY